MQEKNESPEGPECAAANRFRLSKPTDNWDAIVAFYRDGLGLRKVAAFEDHAGYDGMILGLPGLASKSRSSATRTDCPRQRRHETI